MARISYLTLGAAPQSTGLALLYPTRPVPVQADDARPAVGVHAAGRHAPLAVQPARTPSASPVEQSLRAADRSAPRETGRTIVNESPQLPDDGPRESTAPDAEVGTVAPRLIPEPVRPTTQTEASEIGRIEPPFDVAGPHAAGPSFREASELVSADSPTAPFGEANAWLEPLAAPPVKVSDRQANDRSIAPLAADHVADASLPPVTRLLDSEPAALPSPAPASIARPEPVVRIGTIEIRTPAPTLTAAPPRPVPRRASAPQGRLTRGYSRTIGAS